MPRSKVAPPGARVPLLVLAVALAAGVVLFVRVHRAIAGAPRAAAPFVAGPARGPAGVHAAR